MAPCSQTYQQAPHSMHSFRLFTRAFFFDISQQSPRQTFTQFPQPLHFSGSDRMNSPVPSTHSTPGYLFEVLVISNHFPLHSNTAGSHLSTHPASRWETGSRRGSVKLRTRA